MSELPAESFRGLLLALANPASINDDVTFIRNAFNFDSTEVKFAEVHGGTPRFTLILSAPTRRLPSQMPTDVLKTVSLAQFAPQEANLVKPALSTPVRCDDHDQTIIGERL
jgi:hypothetical protein